MPDEDDEIRRLLSQPAAKSLMLLGLGFVLFVVVLVALGQADRGSRNCARMPGRVRQVTRLPM